MSSIVAEGQAILDAENARILAEAQAEREAQALAELRVVAPGILALINTLSMRVEELTAQVAMTHQQVLATRYRTPVRDELGTIIGVIDEINPPLWARPMDLGI